MNEQCAEENINKFNGHNFAPLYSSVTGLGLSESLIAGYHKTDSDDDISDHYYNANGIGIKRAKTRPTD